MRPAPNVKLRAIQRDIHAGAEVRSSTCHWMTSVARLRSTAILRLFRDVKAGFRKDRPRDPVALDTVAMRSPQVGFLHRT